MLTGNFKHLEPNLLDEAGNHITKRVRRHLIHARRQGQVVVYPDQCYTHSPRHAMFQSDPVRQDLGPPYTPPIVFSRD